MATKRGKGERFKPFDVADHLDDLDGVAGYLEIALEASKEDPTAVPRALGVIARPRNTSEPRRVGMSRDGLTRRSPMTATRRGRPSSK